MADHRFEEFRGYICKDFSTEEEKDNDESEEDVADQWDDQELDAAAAGALHVQQRKAPYRKVEIRSLDNRRTVDVHGNFLSTDPWWEVTVTLRPKESRGTLHQGKKVIRGMTCQPSYRLRSDAGLDKDDDDGSIMVQFLSKCQISDVTTKDQFIRHVRKHVLPGSHVNFETLFRVLEDNELIEDEKMRGIVCLVKQYVMNSECGVLVQQSMENPTLFQLLPKLLPNRTVALMKQCTGENKLKLQVLQATLQEKPWAFGFSMALRREANMVLTEVSVDRFQQAGVLEGMERHIQDALHCYHILKKQCWSEGHTFLWERSVRKQLKNNFPGYQVQNWEQMWEFLEEIDAVHIKRGKWTKIFLIRYWKAENQIVKCLTKILECKEEVNEDDDSQQHQDSLDLTQLFQGVARGDESFDNSLDISGENIKSSSLETKADDDYMHKHECSPKLTQAERDQKNFKDDMSQHAAAKSIRDNPFTIISGKGGCGKTHVACTVLAEYPAHTVTMAAPTGKAASNLRKLTHDVGAYTLHQISFQYTLFMRKMKEYEKQKHLDSDIKEPQFKFEDTKILVVDECSMVPITVFSNVLHALLYHGKLKKLVLLGDYRQLPSVEPGNLLSDLYGVFKQYGWSIELTRNHRAESQLIVDNATLISNQKMPRFDADMGFQLVELREKNGFYDVQFLHEVVKKLYNEDESIHDHTRSQFVAFRRADCNLLNDWCCPIYSDHHCTDSKKKALFQTGDKICPTRNANVSDLSSPDQSNYSLSSARTSLHHDSNGEEMYGESSGVVVEEQMVEEQMAEAANRNSSVSLQQTSSTNFILPNYEGTSGPTVCKKELTEQQLKEEADEIEFLSQLCSQHPESPSPGDLSTSHETNEKSEVKGSQDEKRICNGEIYFIENVHEVQDPAKKRKDELVTITDGDTSLCVTLHELRRKAFIKHAWARTIHTYQGSESETVVYLLGNSKAQNWQHVYTAITRGKSKVYIMGTKSQLQEAIRRDFKPRNTELKEILKEEIVPMLRRMHHEENVKYQSMVGNSSQNTGLLSSQMHNIPHSRGTSPDYRHMSPATYLTQRESGIVSGTNQGVVRESSQQWNQFISCSPVKSFTFVKYTTETPPSGKFPIHSTPKKPESSFACGNSKESETQYDDWSREWSQEDLQQINEMEETALGGSSRTSCSPVRPFTSTKNPPKTPSSGKFPIHSTPKKQMSSSTCNKLYNSKIEREYDDWSREWSQEDLQQINEMEETALEGSSRTSCSPVKPFTSTKDPPKTPSSGKVLIHSTPKRPESSIEYNKQCHNKGSKTKYDDWSKEWSEDDQQQINEMEETALSGSSRSLTPSLFDDKEDSVQPLLQFSHENSKYGANYLKTFTRPSETEYDDFWSKEWSEEDLQQINEMEETALEGSYMNLTPPLFEDEEGSEQPLFQSKQNRNSGDNDAKTFTRPNMYSVGSTTGTSTGANILNKDSVQAMYRGISSDHRRVPATTQLTQKRGSSFVSGTNPQVKMPPARTFNFFRPQFTSTQMARTETEVVHESSQQWNQKISSCSPVKPFTSTRDPPNTHSSGKFPIHSTPKKQKSSLASNKQCQSKESKTKYDDWSKEWSEEELQQINEMEETALGGSSTNLTPPLLENEGIGEQPLFQSKQNRNSGAKNYAKTFTRANTYNLGSTLGSKTGANILSKDSIQPVYKGISPDHRHVPATTKLSQKRSSNFVSGTNPQAKMSPARAFVFIHPQFTSTQVNLAKTRVVQESSQQQNQEIPYSQVKPFTSIKDPPKTPSSGEVLIHSTPKKPDSSFACNKQRNSKESETQYDDWPKEWSEEDLQHINEMEKTALTGSSRNATPHVFEEKGVSKHPVFQSTPKNRISGANYANSFANSGAQEENVKYQSMTGHSPQNRQLLPSQTHNVPQPRRVSPDHRYMPSAIQSAQRGSSFVSGANQRVAQDSSQKWNKSISYSPVKSFTSVKDPPKTPPSSKGLIRSTPKKPKSSFACGKQCNSKESEIQYDDWSKEWSEDDLQQISEIEETALSQFEDKGVSEQPMFKSTLQKSNSGANYANAFAEANMYSVGSNMDTDTCANIMNKDSVQLLCNTSTTATYSPYRKSMQGQGFESPPPSRKVFSNQKVSPFTPDTTPQPKQCSSLKGRFRNVAKRLFVDVEELPITDGLPNKKHSHNV